MPTMVDRRRLPSRAELDRILRDRSWDAGNEVLYAMCRKFPVHRKEPEILATMWLIGRSYAAGIERGATSRYKGDDLYTRRVGPVLAKSDIDRVIGIVRRLRRPDPEVVLRAHARIVSLFRRISGLYNESLASKYLHFHCPKSVNIYDSRAALAIRYLTVKPNLSVSSNRP